MRELGWLRGLKLPWKLSLKTDFVSTWGWKKYIEDDDQKKKSWENTAKKTLEQRKIKCSNTVTQILVAFLNRMASMGFNLGLVALSYGKMESPEGVVLFVLKLFWLLQNNIGIFSSWSSYFDLFDVVFIGLKTSWNSGLTVLN